jgi:formyltetrahydrofolate-dependent phosphoribosylglycinamide formyltransferase
MVLKFYFRARMFRKLQEKWKVNGWRLLVILITFAIGGSLTGLAGKKILHAMNISSPALYIPVYVITVTFLWPLIVLLVSIPLGQFHFFSVYIGKLFQRVRSGRGGKEPALPARTTSAKDRSTDGRSPVPQARIPCRVAIFASGAGSNAQQIINHFRDHPLVKIALVVCNREGAGVIDIAARENIPLLLVQRKSFAEGTACLEHLQKERIDFIVLAGFLLRMPLSLVVAFPRRIVNIHPALLPRFGGAGMYGQFVHEAVIQSGETESGITIHYVDEHYDNGDVIFQTACPVLEGDTPETIARRIHQLEHLHYPRVVEEILGSLAASLSQ